MESSTISALLAYSPAARLSAIQETLPKFSSQLKDNFEDRNLWMRFSLTLSLTSESAQSAIQAYNECLRIDQFDPLPAMLAARLMLEQLDDLENGLEYANEAILRCSRLSDPKIISNDVLAEDPTLDGINNNSTTTNNNRNNEHFNGSSLNTTSLTSSPTKSKSLALNSAATNPTITTTNTSSSHYLEAKCCYKNIAPLLSKCYLLASIMHAHIYEREPESIRQFKGTNLKASLHYLDLATQANPDDYLVYFHKALHDARQRTYPAAIDNIRKAIKLNPYHVPSMQLLILLLSALKHYEDALVLCESSLHEFQDDLLLLYIKCNLEQCLVETKGYKAALSTAQHMLRCIRKSSNSFREQKTKYQLEPTKSIQQDSKQQTTNLFAEGKFDSIYRRDSVSDELSVWLLVAEIFIKIGSVSDAELCIDEGSTHVNGALSHQIMFVRGLISKAKNNLIEAKSFFQSCLALCPKHAMALQQLAHVHYLLGNYSTAEKFLKDSLDLDSNCAKTWDYLSSVYIETNQREKANESVKKASSLGESSPVVSIFSISRLTLE